MSFLKVSSLFSLAFALSIAAVSAASAAVHSSDFGFSPPPSSFAPSENEHVKLAHAFDASANVGFTYTPSPGLPPPEAVANYLVSLNVSIVRLVNPTPAAVGAFSGTKITLLLSISDSHVYKFATRPGIAVGWVYDFVVPFYQNTRISAISVGYDMVKSSELVEALRNLHSALNHYGMRSISVSTALSFRNTIASMFPPSSGKFLQPIDMIPLLRFLQDTNSPFLVMLYPYEVQRFRSEITLGFALFSGTEFDFCHDSGRRYYNLFDVMVDSVFAALSKSGYSSIPIVTETGWPTSDDETYAEMYLKGLITHLKSDGRTSSRKARVSETYIYQLFDDPVADNGESWGLLYSNFTIKHTVSLAKPPVHSSLTRCQICTGVLVMAIAYGAIYGAWRCLRHDRRGYTFIFLVAWSAIWLSSSILDLIWAGHGWWEIVVMFNHIGITLCALGYWSFTWFNHDAAANDAIPLNLLTFEVVLWFLAFLLAVLELIVNLHFRKFSKIGEKLYPVMVNAFAVLENFITKLFDPPV